MNRGQPRSSGLEGQQDRVIRGSVGTLFLPWLLLGLQSHGEGMFCHHVSAFRTSMPLRWGRGLVTAVVAGGTANVHMPSLGLAARAQGAEQEGSAPPRCLRAPDSECCPSTRGASPPMAGKAPLAPQISGNDRARAARPPALTKGPCTFLEEKWITSEPSVHNKGEGWEARLPSSGEGAEEGEPHSPTYLQPEAPAGSAEGRGGPARGAGEPWCFFPPEF